MAKGYDKQQLRHDTLSQFGKDLARRSSSHCELCGISNTPLRVCEIPPTSIEPNFNHCIFICDTCREQIENPKKRNTMHLHCLSRSVWSEVPAVQAISLSLLFQLTDEAWATNLLEQVYISPEIAEWLELIAATKI